MIEKEGGNGTGGEREWKMRVGKKGTSQGGRMRQDGVEKQGSAYRDVGQTTRTVQVGRGGEGDGESKHLKQGQEGGGGGCAGLGKRPKHMLSPCAHAPHLR